MRNLGINAMPAPYTQADVDAGVVKYRGGAPRKYQDPEELQRKCNEYFDDDETYPQKSVYALSYHLGFVDRQQIDKYIARGDEFSLILAQAKQRIMAHYDVTGQVGRGGHFCSAMLDRMGDVVIPAGGGGGNTYNITVFGGGAQPQDQLEPSQAKQVESKQQDTLDSESQDSDEDVT